MTAPDFSSFRCPTIDTLESFASGAVLADDVLSHVSSCESCKDAIENIRTNNELLAEFASANAQLNSPPQQFGHYEVLGLLGAGGMGEVYRARDTRLDRDVALKILPAAFAHNPERVARFRREATLLASLNHPHIAAVYGFEQSEDIQFLLLELVEGETLAERLNGGPLPITEVISVCKQIAEGLEAAHARGVIHRDLKPANVKITPQGTVKVLDFGLAKAFAPESTSSSHDPETELTAVYTPRGIIIGTAAYMSPEQARSQSLDKQTDIWSFGCLLYECLTGSRPFNGETTSDLIARILERSPDETALPEETPPSLRRLLRRCLEKDRAKRLRDIGDAVLDLDSVDDGPTSTQQGTTTPPARKWRYALFGAILALVVLTPPSLWVVRSLNTEHSSRVVCSCIVAPPGTTFFSTGDFAGPPVLSPDGRSVAFVSTSDLGHNVLCVRRLDGDFTHVLRGTESACFPFWSPDSQSIGFFSGDKLKRVDLVGGPPTHLCGVNDPRGGAWGPNDFILFAPAYNLGIHRIDASTPNVLEPVTVLDKTIHTTHRWPVLLPDGMHFLYLAANRNISKSEHNAIYWASLDGKENRLLLRSNANVVFASPYLLFLQDKTLKAQRFDPDHGRLEGNPTILEEEILYDPTTFRAVFDASADGILLLQQGEGYSTLVIVDRESREQTTISDKDLFNGVRLSPNAKSVAVNCGDPSDIWVHDVDRKVKKLLMTDSDASDVCPSWTKEGDIVYASLDRSDLPPIMIRTSTDGVGKGKILKEFTKNFWVTDITADNQYLIFEQVGGLEGKRDLYTLPLSGSTPPTPYLQSPSQERDGQFAPNGRWIAYTSDESGRDEVYVAPSPFVDDADQPKGLSTISRDGGRYPRWRSDGKELFFLAPNNYLMAAEVDSEKGAFHVQSIRPLFQTQAKGKVYSYDVFPGGKKFIINSTDGHESSPITLVQNWQSKLEKK
ncbi:MAG: protein kinase [Planctomycetota bacterium]